MIGGLFSGWVRSRSDLGANRAVSAAVSSGQIVSVPPLSVATLLPPHALDSGILATTASKEVSVIEPSRSG
jgi:hypothetical protein